MNSEQPIIVSLRGQQMDMNALINALDAVTLTESPVAPLPSSHFTLAVTGQFQVERDQYHQLFGTAKYVHAVHYNGCNGEYNQARHVVLTACTNPTPLSVQSFSLILPDTLPVLKKIEYQHTFDIRSAFKSGVVCFDYLPIATLIVTYDDGGTSTIERSPPYQSAKLTLMLFRYSTDLLIVPRVFPPALMPSPGQAARIHCIWAVLAKMGLDVSDVDGLALADRYSDLTLVQITCKIQYHVRRVYLVQGTGLAKVCTDDFS